MFGGRSILVFIMNRGIFVKIRKHSTRLNDDYSHNVNGMVVSSSAVICALDKN